MKKANAEKVYRRHKAVYSILLPVVSPFIKLKFKLSCSISQPIEGPFLMLANHNTDWDPIITSVALQQQLYYVASEHIFRWGLLSKLINWLVAPIPRTKGSVESGAALAILKHLKRGHSIGMFAEGNRSFNGVTGKVHPATAKLVSRSGVQLVTLRIKGGYFTSPRWSHTMRRGAMEVECVGVYSPQELKKMSLSDIDALLQRDLFEDAYDPAAKPAAYKGKALAEYLETALFVCPACGGIGTMQSRGSTLACSCGHSVEYLAHGSLCGGSFDSVKAWDAWQRGELAKKLDAASDQQPICRDAGMNLYSFGPEHKQLSCLEGELLLHKDRICVCGREFLFSSLEGFSIYGRNTLVFTDSGVHYEIKGPVRYSALKYLYAYEKALGIS